MSCDWSVHCLDCQATHRFGDANHQEDVMLLLCKHAAAIAGLAGLVAEPALQGWGVGISTPWGSVDPAWFRDHLGHRLAPINEYGQILGRCSEWVTCECGTVHPCAREQGHDGEHRRNT